MIGLCLPLIAALIGCRADPIADLERYEAVLASREGDWEAQLRRCAAIRDQALAGDCALVVITRTAAAENSAPEARCDRVPEGVWRDECYFLAAEAWRRQQPARAAKLCGQSGAFAPDCAQHLWQSSIYAAIHDAGPGAFAERLPTAQRIYDHWARFLGERDEFTDRFWERYYQNGFDRSGVDLAACEALPEAQAARCVAAGEKLVLQELAPRLDRADAWDAFCALSPATSDNAGHWLHLTPHPDLDGLIAERQAELCGLRRR